MQKFQNNALAILRVSLNYNVRISCHELLTHKKKSKALNIRWSLNEFSSFENAALHRKIKTSLLFVVCIFVVYSTHYKLLHSYFKM